MICSRNIQLLRVGKEVEQLSLTGVGFCKGSIKKEERARDWKIARVIIMMGHVISVE